MRLATGHRDKMAILNVPTPGYPSDGEFAALGDSASRFLDTLADAEQVKLWRKAGLIPRTFWKAVSATLLRDRQAQQSGIAGRAYIMRNAG